MSVFTKKVRGFRLLDLIGIGFLIALILGVYLAKTMAGRERAEIASVEREIKAETSRIRLLQAEVAHLEQPGRIERLAVTYLKMEAVPANREASPAQLPRMAVGGLPPKAKAPSPVAALFNASNQTPGVPPPGPHEAAPVRVAEAQPAAAPAPTGAPQ
ncbi:cell division protein [Phenylobacterium sp.]|uniref:cell division protein FtsL n=1 Tax=Phenylobacterium sp. TaxID=1871053 RepID=UPI0025DFF283|nr:cell division protein [Phenylobacterium sp.]MBX3483174.1 cell division protein [Phenylobacterium sp.]MCW5759260.1 cell division protein [Phenylobacterium sp.]